MKSDIKLELLNQITYHKAVIQYLIWRADGQALLIAYNDSTIGILENTSLDIWRLKELSCKSHGCDQVLWVYLNNTLFTPHILIASSYMNNGPTKLILTDVMTKQVLCDVKCSVKVLRGNGIIIYQNYVLVIGINSELHLYQIVKTNANRNYQMNAGNSGLAFKRIHVFTTEVSNSTLALNSVWHRNFVSVATISSDGYLYIAVNEYTIQTYDIKNIADGPIQQIEVESKQKGFIRSIKCIPTKNNLLISLHTGLIMIIDRSTGKAIWEKFLPTVISEPISKLSSLVQHCEASDSLAFHLIGFGLPDCSPDGRFIACGVSIEGKGQVVLWDLSSKTRKIGYTNTSSLPYIVSFNHSYNLLAESSRLHGIWAFHY